MTDKKPNVAQGTEWQRVALLGTFTAAAAAYFALGAPGVGALAPPGAGAVAAKCAPVLCLLALVLHQHRAAPFAAEPRARYARLVALGLALSALGDALLAWPDAAHFVCGMAAFAGAHCAYLRALGWAPRAPALATLCYAPTAAFLTQLRPPGALRLLVPLYALLLATTAWRALARGGAAAPGGLLFLLSDAVLGYSMFGGPGRVQGPAVALLMSTYYLAQLCFALSALEPAARAPRAARRRPQQAQ